MLRRRWWLQRARAVEAELRVRQHGADAGAAVPGQVGVPVLGVPAEVLDRVGQVAAEVPHARGLVRPECERLRAQRPVRVELRADRRGGAVRTCGGVAQERRAADVGLVLNLRIRLPVALEWS